MKTGSGNRSDRCTIAVISVSTTTPILIAMSTADCGAVEVLASILMLLSFPSSQAAPIPLCAFYTLYAGTTLHGSTAGCFVGGEGRAAASCSSCPQAPRNPRTSPPLPVGRRPPPRPFAYPLATRHGVPFGHQLHDLLSPVGGVHPATERVPCPLRHGEQVFTVNPDRRAAGRQRMQASACRLHEHV